MANIFGREQDERSKREDDSDITVLVSPVEQPWMLNMVSEMNKCLTQQVKSLKLKIETRSSVSSKKKHFILVCHSMTRLADDVRNTCKSLGLKINDRKVVEYLQDGVLVIFKRKQAHTTHLELSQSQSANIATFKEVVTFTFWELDSFPVRQNKEELQRLSTICNNLCQESQHRNMAENMVWDLLQHLWNWITNQRRSPEEFSGDIKEAKMEDNSDHGLVKDITVGVSPSEEQWMQNMVSEMNKCLTQQVKSLNLQTERELSVSSKKKHFLLVCLSMTRLADDVRNTCKSLGLKINDRSVIEYLQDGILVIFQRKQVHEAHMELPRSQSANIPIFKEVVKFTFWELDYFPVQQNKEELHRLATICNNLCEKSQQRITAVDPTFQTDDMNTGTHTDHQTSWHRAAWNWITRKVPQKPGQKKPETTTF